MKKWIAMILALALALTCTAASAGMVHVRMSVDREAAKDVLKDFGVPERLLAVTDPMISLASALGVKVTTMEDGVQVDLDLNGENALSLGYASDAEGIRLASTLFPNYVLTLKLKTSGQTKETFMPSNLPGTENDRSGEETMSIMPTSVQTYIQSFVIACVAAAVPGEPVQGEYEFDGCKFDTMVPITVDVPVVKDAFHGLTEDLLKDEGILGIIRRYAGKVGADLSVDLLREGFKVFEAHFPEMVTAEFYQNSSGGETFYVTGRAGYAGKETPSYEYSMLYRDGKNYTMTYQDHEHGLTAGMAFRENGFRMEFTCGGKSLAFDFTAEEGDPAVCRCGVFYKNMEKPLISVEVTSASAGERTLPLEAGGKTVLALEDVLSGKSGAASGLLGDIIMNGFGPLMTKLSEAVPEAARLIMGLIMPQKGQPGTKTPEPAAEPEPKQEVDKSSWKTLGDVLSLESSDRESTWDDEHYCYIFHYAGTQWMVIAKLSKEQSDAIAAVDYLAEDRDEQIRTILGPCEILAVYNLAEMALSQEDLDQWIGKTGQEMLDAGWVYNGYHSDETGIHVILVWDKFEYCVSFAEELVMGQTFGEMPENFSTATVTGFTFEGKSYNFSEMDFLNPQ